MEFIAVFIGYTVTQSAFLSETNKLNLINAGHRAHVLQRHVLSRIESTSRA